MALRSVLRKLPPLGLKAPAGAPVHAPSPPAAAHRHMTSHARTRYVDPDPRINKLLETLDQQNAANKKAHRDMLAIIRGDVAKLDMLSKAVCYPINAFSALVVLRHLF